MRSSMQRTGSLAAFKKASANAVPKNNKYVKAAEAQNLSVTPLLGALVTKYQKMGGR